LTGGGGLVAGEVCVYEIDDEFGWVHVERDGVAEGGEVGVYVGDGAVEDGFAAGEEEQLVEEGEGCGGRLVDGCYDDDLYF
jgi:hypothetical protein